MSDFARIADVKAGAIVKADGRFSCIGNGAIKEVKADRAGELYVECTAYSGKHFLSGQVDDEGETYLGLSLISADPISERDDARQALKRLLEARGQDRNAAIAGAEVLLRKAGMIP